MRITIAYLLFALCLSFVSYGQRSYPKLSAAAGLSVGHGKYNKGYQASLGYGAKADFQYNANKFFSFRAALEYFTNSTTVTTEYFPEGQYRTLHHTPRTINLNVGPLFYYRFYPFNVHGGILLSLSHSSQKYYYDFYYKDGSDFVEFSSDPEINYDNGFSISPLIGMAYVLGKKKRPYGEVEIEIRYNRWINGKNTNSLYDYRSFEYQVIQVLIGYRILFKT